MGAPRRLDASVCVVGGGPAGTTLATKLAMLGHDVCLVERASFPRRHLGESLTPGVVPLLQTIGADDVARSTGASIDRVTVEWADGVRDRRNGGRPGLVVDRAHFDAALLGYARSQGVRVWSPAAIRTRRLDPDGWCLTLETPDAQEELRVRFIADATGRSRALPGKRHWTGCRSMALYAYYRGQSAPPEPRIEAGHDAWYWRVPLPDGSQNLLVFVDASRLHALLSVDSLEAIYEKLLGASGLIEASTGVQRVSPIRVADATPYLDDECVNRHSIKVGDAALAIDPLSSSGVQRAVQSALSGAVVVNTLLRRPERSDAAFEFYRGSLQSASQSHAAWAADHYRLVAEGTAERFWLDRAGPAPSNERPERSRAPVATVDARALAEARVALSNRLELVDTPCIHDEFVAVQPALWHPNLERPCAFLDGIAIAPLLDRIEADMTPLQIARRWSPELSLRSGLSITGWLMRNGILVEKHRRERASE